MVFFNSLLLKIEKMIKRNIINWVVGTCIRVISESNWKHCSTSEASRQELCLHSIHLATPHWPTHVAAQATNQKMTPSQCLVATTSTLVVLTSPFVVAISGGLAGFFCLKVACTGINKTLPHRYLVSTITGIHEIPRNTSILLS